MKKDKDCPYKRTCSDGPECCEECDWHLAFEKFRRRIVRMENRLSRANALLEYYRGVKGCRMQEMMDAEIQGRCLTLPAYTSDDIEDFGELYEEFMSTLRVDPPVESIMEIGEAIGKFLKDMAQATILREVKEGNGNGKKEE